MLDDIIRRHFGPLIGVLTSDNVEKIINKNGLNFCDMLIPFSTVQCTVKDPSGSSVTTRLVLDIRDIQRDGFLLSLTVLPSVLHESVSSSCENVQSAFIDSLLQWSEPSEHELLRTYLACVFVVSSDETDPLAELRRLIHMQHTQQHGSTSQSIGPGHFVAPKWMLPNIFKYYVVVDDVSNGDEIRANEVYSSVCAEYGDANCHLLRVNSGEGTDDKLPDPWQSCLDVKYRGLERGLELARRSVLSKINAYSKDATLESSSVPSLSDLPLTTPVKQHGTMLTKEDRDCIQNFLETMLKQCIIPFVEKQLKLLNEQINARRGLSRSLTTGVRKLFSANTQPQSNISYSQESNEMQTRRLADMCFMFGLYSFAYQIYQSIKKEFALDQAGLYYAGALEMAAITYYLSNTNLNQYPQRYMENAIEYYTNTCLRPLLGVRAALLNSVILDSIDLNIEAASQLLRLANMENDLLSGMLEMRASEMFSKGSMPRKMAFHYILAGHRFFKCGLFKLSFDCYRNALPLFLHKQWSFAEDHLLYKLASESNNCTSLREALEWCSEIIKSLWTSQQQDADQQLTFIKLYLYLLKSYALDDNNNIPLIDIPFIKSQNVIVIHGDRPLRSCSDDHKDTINWKDVELAAYNKLNGSSLNFKSTPLVSDSTTDNSEMRCTPPFERLRFQFEFQNPFDISLTLKNIHLGLRNDTDLLELSSIDELVLEPKQRVDDVQLYVIPSDEVTEVHVTSVVFDVVVETLCVTAQIALSLRGARLCSTAASKQVLYGKDERLNVSISAKRWPLLETEMIQPSSSIMQTYCNQISYVDCDLINIGSVPVRSFCIATNQFDLINVFDGDDSHSGVFKWISMEHCLSPINRSILLFKPVGNDHIAIGQRRRIRIAVRSPSEEVKGHRICLLLFYVGDNGMYREQRQTLSVDTRAVLSTSMRMVDESNGICVLSATNLISKRNSQLIANVELIRIKSIVNTDLRHSSTPPNVFLRTIRNRNVHLECEQMDNYCFIVSSNNVNNSLTNLIYITNNNSDINDDNISFEWPSSPIANNDFNNYSMDSVNNKSLLSLSFAVLWRASMFNTDGTVTNVIGENIIKDPFPLVSSALTDYKFMSALNKDVQAVNSFSSMNVDTHNDEVYRAFVCNVSVHPPIISHDFSVRRFCTISLRISVLNNDVHHRDATVQIRYISDTNNNTNEKVKNDYGSEFLLSSHHNASSSSMISLPLQKQSSSSNINSNNAVTSNIKQLLITPDRCVYNKRLDFNEKHTFHVKLSVACASVYQIDSFELSCKFIDNNSCCNNNNAVSFVLPTVYASVIDRRVNFS